MLSSVEHGAGMLIVLFFAMNAEERPLFGSDDDGSGALEEFKMALTQAAAGKDEKDRFGREAANAILRLARACYGHDDSQAQTVARALASIYNGRDALPVRLDELRWLDWHLQRDLVTVLVGTGHAGFEDTAICEAFRAVGGITAVDWFRWYTTGGPHRAALCRLASFVAHNRYCSSATTIRNFLRALYNRTTVLSVGKLMHLGGDLGRDVAFVLRGMIERDSSVIREDTIEQAFRTANILEALMDDVWPRSNEAPNSGHSEAEIS